MDEDIKHIEEEEDEKKETGGALSHTRVRRIIKSDPDTKQIANDAVYLISRATVRHSLGGFVHPNDSCALDPFSDPTFLFPGVSVLYFGGHLRQEMFLEQFATLVYQETQKEKKKTIQYNHLGTRRYNRPL